LRKSLKFGKINKRKLIKIKINIMKTFIRSILQFAVIVTISLCVISFNVYAKSSLPLEPKGNENQVKLIFEQAGIATPAGQSGGNMNSFDTIRTIAYTGLSYLKGIIVVVGIIMLSIMGIKLVINGESEEDVTTVRRGVIYSLIAFLIISMAKDLANVFDMGSNPNCTDANCTILSSPTEIVKRVRLFDKQVEIFITFIKYMIGAYATIMIIRSAIKLVTSGGDDEETSKHKKGIMYSVAGLMLLLAGDTIIKKVFYITDWKKYSTAKGAEIAVNANEGIRQIVGITNFIVSIIGPIAVLLFLVAGIMYATAGGEEEKMEKAKRILVTTIVGVAIVFGAFAIVSTIVSGGLTETVAQK